MDAFFKSMIGEWMNWVIIGFGIITLFGFLKVRNRVKRLEKSMEEAAKKNRPRQEYMDGGYVTGPEVHKREDSLPFLNEFNEIQIDYAMFEQFVPIFPLLGILGTVLGLIRQLGDAAKMMDALSLSMSTTLWGLAAAISLRLCDALFVSRELNKMECHFDNEEQKYAVVKDKHALDSEK